MHCFVLPRYEKRKPVRQRDVKGSYIKLMNTQGYIFNIAGK